MMGQTDIRRLFEILLEYQELSPEIARMVLARILRILQEWKDGRGEGRCKRLKEREDIDDEM